MRTAVAAGALLLLLTACSADPAPAPAPSPSPTPSAGRSAAPAPSASPSPPAQALPQRCENRGAGYAVRFPADWFVEEKPEIAVCAFFDDEPIDVPPRSEATGVDLRVDVRDVPLDSAWQDSLSEGEKTAEDVDLDGRRAVRVTGTLTEEVLLPAGTQITSWLVDLDGRALLLSVDDAGAEDYEAAVEVLDRMAASVEVL